MRQTLTKVQRVPAAAQQEYLQLRARHFARWYIIDARPLQSKRRAKAGHRSTVTLNKDVDVKIEEAKQATEAANTAAGKANDAAASVTQATLDLTTERKRWRMLSMPARRRPRLPSKQPRPRSHPRLISRATRPSDRLPRLTAQKRSNPG